MGYHNDKSAATMRWVLRPAAVLALALVAMAGRGEAKSWNQVANIKASAVKLAELQVAKGALGTFEFIANCYRTHELAEKFGASLQGCMVQDYIHSRITAAVYAKLPESERQRMGVPGPDDLVNGMLGRVGATMAKYKLTQADAEKFIADIDKHGIPAFTKARFPNTAE